MLRTAPSPLLNRLAHPSATARSVSRSAIARRWVNITATTPSPDASTSSRLSVEAPTGPVVSPDAHFEVVGSPFSLLSVSLAASQNLYTRRGTLVGLQGKPENTQSTLSFLEPFRRAPFGIPFLYQKISATSPITALISTTSSIASIVTVQLDGRQDWLVAQRQALLAWSGLTLSLKPQYNMKLGIANWGNTLVTGRGIMALSGGGQIYQVQLKAGESYVAHPSNVVAYTASPTPPLPFRFKSSRLIFQVPDLGFGSMLQNVKFFRIMGQTSFWRNVGAVYHTVKTWFKRSVYGDRLFLRFEGPTTMLIQSRASRISDVLTLKETDEIASSQPGAVEDAITRKIREEIRDIESHHADIPKTVPIASVEAGDASKVKYFTIRNGQAELDRSR